MEDYKNVKIALVGAPMIGKTSLASLLANESIPYDYISTIGVDMKFAYDSEHKTKISIWDMSGSPRFADVLKVFIPKLDCILFCYSCSDETSLLEMKVLHRQYLKNGYLNGKKAMVVMCKADLPKDFSIEADARKYALMNNMIFISSSALRKEGKEVLLETICRGLEPLQTKQSVEIENIMTTIARYCGCRVS